MYYVLLIMKKRGLFGMIILGTFVLLLVVGIGAGIYFYNYYVFKEVRVCVGNWEDSKFPCKSRDECLSVLNFDNEIMVDAPSLIKNNFDNILDGAVYCEGSCFVGKIRGVDYENGEIGNVECVEGEDEFVMEIRGRDGLEILKWMRSLKK